MSMIEHDEFLWRVTTTGKHRAVFYVLAYDITEAVEKAEQALCEVVMDANPEIPSEELAVISVEMEPATLMIEVDDAEEEDHQPMPKTSTLPPSLFDTDKDPGKDPNAA